VYTILIIVYILIVSIHNQVQKNQNYEYIKWLEIGFVPINNLNLKKNRIPIKCFKI